MQESMRTYLLDVTRKLIDHKITGKYKRLTKSGGKESFVQMMLNHLPQQADKQLDLEGVESNLKEKKYASFEQWLADVNKVLDTPLPKSQDDKVSERKFRKEANHYVLRKLLKGGPATSLEKWANKIVEIRKKIKELNEEPPAKVHQIVPSLCNVKAIGEMKILSQNEISAFLKAAQMLYSEEHHIKMLDILREEEYGIQYKATDLVFDINRLKPTTVFKLKKYMESALAAQGLEYPKA